MWLLAIGLSFTAQAEIDGVVAGLTQDIQASQRALDSERGEIERKLATLDRQIDHEGSGLRQLRERVNVMRRTADESALSLDALERRLEQWRAQDVYHRNLLRDFAERQGQVGESADHETAIDAALAVLEGGLAPEFEPVTVSRESGELVTADQLQLGPIRWFAFGEEAGLLVQSAGSVPQTALVFDGDALANLQEVRLRGSGRLAFDPTVDRFLQAKVADESLLEHLQAGGLWVMPILGFALLSLTIGIGKAVQFMRLPKLQPVLGNAHSTSEAAGWLEQLAPLQQSMLETSRAAGSAEDREERLYQFLVIERQRVGRFLGAVAVTATVAPLLGLLGTVSGMINTFGMMTIFGAGDPAIVSGGISEALVTTEMGLVVAIPALIIHALLARKAAAYMQ